MRAGLELSRYSFWGWPIPVVLFVDRFRSVGAGEVVEAGDAEHRDGMAVALAGRP